jgi:hypothetical protein
MRMKLPSLQKSMLHFCTSSINLLRKSYTFISIDQTFLCTAINTAHHCTDHIIFKTENRTEFHSCFLSIQQKSRIMIDIRQNQSDSQNCCANLIPIQFVCSKNEKNTCNWCRHKIRKSSHSYTVQFCFLQRNRNYIKYLI